MKLVKRYGLRVVVFLITVLVLYTIVDARTLKESFGKVQWQIIAGALIIAVIRNYLLALRWKVLNSGEDKQLKNKDYFRYVSIASTLNVVLPGSTTGDIAKVAFVMKDLENNKAKNGLVILADKIIGFISILVFGVIAFNLSDFPVDRFYLNAFFISISLCGILALYGFYKAKTQLFNKVSKVLGGYIGGFIVKTGELVLEQMRFYKANLGKVFTAFLMCIPVHFLWFLIVYLFARQLHISIDFIEISMITAVSWLITSIPISFGGLGVRELSFTFFLSYYSVSAEQAVALSLLQYSITLMLAIIGLPLLLLNKKKDVVR